MIKHWKLLYIVTFIIIAIASYQPAYSADYCFHGHCIIRVKGITYMNSNCEITTWDDGFEFVGKSKYFASVDLDKNGSAKGYWNGKGAESHAQDELGKLYRKNECWVNDSAELCAVKRTPKKCDYMH